MSCGEVFPFLVVPWKGEERGGNATPKLGVGPGGPDGYANKTISRTVKFKRHRYF